MNERQMGEKCEEGVSKGTQSLFSIWNISQVESAFCIEWSIVKYGTSQLPQILLCLGQLGSKEGGAPWHPWPVYVGWHRFV